jgi:hypothetical protein
VEFWADEDYTMDKAKGDFKMEKHWVKQIWRGVKLGEQNQENAIFPILEPVPYQYKSLTNPWGVKLPYVGLKYGKLFDNTENVAPLDLMKTWQFKYNRVFSRIEEKEAMDIGKVLLLWMGIKPDNYEWHEWMAMLKYGRISPVDLEDAGITPQDLQNVRTLDLSHTYDLMAMINYADYIRTSAGLAVGVNPSRLGEMSPYATRGTNEQNLFQSRNQTEDLFRSHNMVVQNVMNEAVGCARVAYKNNPPKKTYVLDDLSVAELDLDWELLKRSEIGVFIKMSGFDLQNLETMKARSLEMIQGGLINFPEMVRLQMASSPAEVLNLSERAQQRMEEMQARQAEAAQMEAQMERELRMSEKDKDAQLQIALKNMELEQSERNSIRDSQKLAVQWDINKDGKNDNIEAREVETQHDAIQKEQDRRLEREKLAQDKELEMRKLDIEEMKAKRMGGPKK